MQCQHSNELQLEITHLVTNGCSFTFGDELDDPKTQAWPALLAKHLGIPVVNLALPGTGNDCILRRTTEYLYENLPTGSKPLVVIAWSQDWRREEWFLDQWYLERNYNNYGIVSFPGDKPQNYYEYALLENLSDEDTYRKTLQRKIAMHHLLKTFDIPYITTNFAHSQYDIKTLNRMKERFSVMDSIIENDPYKIIDMYSFADKYPKCPNGHNGPEAQVAVAEYIFNRITELHGTIEVSKNPHLTLREFNRHEDYAHKWLHWVNAN